MKGKAKAKLIPGSWTDFNGPPPLQMLLCQLKNKPQQQSLMLRPQASVTRSAATAAAATPLQSNAQYCQQQQHRHPHRHQPSAPAAAALAARVYPSAALPVSAAVPLLLLPLL
jgi:hypothetical protein